MKHTAKQLLVLFMVLVMMLSFGCSAQPTPSEPAAPGSAPAAVVGDTSGQTAGDTSIKSAKDVLTVANTSGEPANLHPYNIMSIGASLVNYCLMNGLIRIGSDSVIQPALAESWEIGDKQITFHLRKGVKFHNGDELKASDVVFSLQQAVAGPGTQHAGNLASIVLEGVTASDDYTVVIPLTNNDSTIMGNLAAIMIVNEKAYTEMGDQYQYNPVGTGAFTIKDWTVGDRIVLERYDDYFEGTPRLSQVIIRTISETSQAMIELETGGVDIVINPQGSDVERVKSGSVPGVKAITVDSCVLRNNNLNFNWLSEPIKDHRVREAMARCIDRETWTSIISPGVGQPAYTMVANGVWGADLTIASNYPYPYDLEKAKALLAEAGYGDGLELTLLTDSRPYHLALVELLQASFSQIGIKLNVQTMELTQQKEICVTGKGFDLYTLDNVAVGNPANFLASLWRDSHPKYATTDSTHYRFYTVNDAQGQKYADIMDEIMITMDDDARLKLAHELQQVFTEDIVWLPVNSIQGYLLTADKLQDVGFINGDVLWVTHLTYFE